MSSFTSELDVRILNERSEGRQMVQLLAPFDFYTDRFGRREFISVPADFKSDFASVPWGLWNIVSPFGRHAKAAVLHDWLCVVRVYDSRIAHELFLEGMEVLGVKPWKRRLMFLAVKYAGPKFKANSVLD